MENELMKLAHEQKLAILYGILLGDGCLSLYKNNRRTYYAISISGCYYDDENFYKNFLCPIIDDLRKGKKKLKIKKRKTQGKIELLFTDKSLFALFNELGFPIGKKGIFLKIPRYFYKKNLLKFVIQGIISTDGSLVLTKNPHKIYPRIELHLISKEIIEQVHKYLLFLGINVKKYRCKRNAEEVNSRFRIQINGKDNCKLFNDLVGFINPKHQIKWERFIIYSERYDKNLSGIPSKLQKKIRAKIKF